MRTLPSYYANTSRQQRPVSSVFVLVEPCPHPSITGTASIADSDAMCTKSAHTSQCCEAGSKSILPVSHAQERAKALLHHQAWSTYLPASQNDMVRMRAKEAITEVINTQLLAATNIFTELLHTGRHAGSQASLSQSGTNDEFPLNSLSLRLCCGV